MADAWRSYLEMAYGLSKTSRKKAEKAVRELVGKGGAKASELQAMAEDLLATGGANRDALVELIRTELDKALERVGLAKAEEVAALRKQVAELEAKIASDAPTKAVAAKKVAPAKKAAPQKAVSTPPAPAAAPARKSAAKKAVAKKTAPGKKAGPAKKASGS